MRNRSQLKVACVNCALRGKVGASFSLDFNINDVLNPFDGDINPFNKAELRLETVEAIDGDFNIEIESTAKGSIQCSFPGMCKQKYNQGEKFQPPTTRQNGTGDAVSVQAH